MITDRPLPPLSGFKWANISLRIAALMCMAVLLGLLAGSEIVIGLGLAAIIIALIVAFAGSLAAWRVQPILERMVAGDHYAHWRYSGAELARHLAAEKRRNITPASTGLHGSVRVIHVPVPAGQADAARSVLDQVLRDWFPQAQRR